MTEEKKAVELTEEEIQSVDGGSGVYNGHRIITGISSAKGCPYYEAGSNFYNKKVMGISKTCGACVHMITESGWHLCEARNEYGGSEHGRKENADRAQRDGT